MVNGNHDINNSYSVDFSKEEYWNADRVQPEDFKKLYDGLGYGVTVIRKPVMRSVFNAFTMKISQT